MSLIISDVPGDGPTDMASGPTVADHSTPPDARDYPDAHDSYGYFQAPDDLLITGATLTNVNDIRAILIA